jgi:hypothetical protein
MNNFLENKQNLLFIGQSIIVLGVSFYFYRRLQAVVFNINELHKLVLNQQEQINKQNMMIESLKNLLTSHSFQRNTEQPRVVVEKDVEETKTNVETIQPKINLPENKNKSRLFSGINSTLIFKNTKAEEKSPSNIEVIDEKNEEENKVEEEDEEDEDLDAELQNELRELESERNLKKR